MTTDERIEDIMTAADDWSHTALCDLGVRLNEYSRTVREFAYGRMLAMIDEIGYHPVVALDKAYHECRQLFGTR